MQFFIAASPALKVVAPSRLRVKVTNTLFITGQTNNHPHSHLHQTPNELNVRDCGRNPENPHRLGENPHRLGENMQAPTQKGPGVAIEPATYLQ